MIKFLTLALVSISIQIVGANILEDPSESNSAPLLASRSNSEMLPKTENFPPESVDPKGAEILLGITSSTNATGYNSTESAGVNDALNLSTSSSNPNVFQKTKDFAVEWYNNGLIALIKQSDADHISQLKSASRTELLVNIFGGASKLIATVGAGAAGIWGCQISEYFLFASAVFAASNGLCSVLSYYYTNKANRSEQNYKAGLEIAGVNAKTMAPSKPIDTTAAFRMASNPYLPTSVDEEESKILLSLQRKPTLANSTSSVADANRAEGAGVRGDLSEIVVAPVSGAEEPNHKGQA